MDELRVLRLRLRAGREGLPAGLAARVEDALRTSTKPPALAHRRVWIRRLRLKAPRGASAQTLALLFEREWAAAAAGAEPLASAAPTAAAVWAADEGEACTLLLRRWVAGWRDGAAEVALGEPWFWSQVAPRASRQPTAAERLAALLFEPWDEGGPARQRAWRGRAWALLGELGAAPAVWAVCDAGRREALMALPGQGPVATAAARAEAPTVAPMPCGASADDDVEPAPLEPMTAPQGASAEEPAASPPSTPQSAHTVAEPSRAVGMPLSAVAPRPVFAETVAAADTDTPRPTPAGLAIATPLHSDWAGLALLLPLLLHAGYDRDEGPRDAALCVALLAWAAARHRADAAAQAWVAQWRGWHDAPVDMDALSIWWRRMRLATLRDARLPLRRLIRRPGEIWSSPHRLDVVFPLRHADLRIRRAGFDLDPGYLPWLDAVIRFHYS